MKIGVIYSLTEEVSKGKKEEKIADNEIEITARAINEILQKKGYDSSLVKLNRPGEIKELTEYNFIFHLAEGINGNAKYEAKIAKFLETNDIAFTGCSSETLKMCTDKEKTKEILIKNNILTPRHQLFKDGEEIDSSLKYPMIIKPVYEDASIGIDLDSVVYNAKKLKEKVEKVIDEYKEAALVEEFIDGRELNVALIDKGNGLEVLNISEIIFDYPEGIPKFLPFEAKWEEDSETYKKSNNHCPADINKELWNELSEIALKCCKITNCEGYARVDFRLDEKNIPYVLEINPNPGINPQDSGFMKAGKAAGLEYEELIMKIFEAALRKNKI